MRTASLLLSTLLLCGCQQNKFLQPSEHTGIGTVRKIGGGFWDADSITHETDGGYVKVLVPLCYGGKNYVWVGMHGDISFHWENYGACYKIDGVWRL